jgi:hypothetical protein
MPGNRSSTLRSSGGPLFLLGAPRSGTSLVYKLLCLHPDTTWISNWVRRFPGIPALAALNRLASRFPDARQRAWFGSDANAYVYGKRRPLGERVFPTPVEGEPIFRRAGLGEAEIRDPDEVSPASVDSLRRAVEEITHFSGRSYLVNKRVANNRRVRLLAEAFPNARFLEIVRDGRAVACSLSMVDWWGDTTIWWNGVTPALWEQSGGDPWELCARSWVEELEVTQRGLATVEPERKMRITYEKFVDRPLEMLSEIRSFAGLRDSDTWHEAISRCEIRASAETWRRLPEDARIAIEAIQASMLRLHGYPVSSEAGRPVAGH